MSVLKARDMKEEELKEKIIVGKLVERNREEFVSILRSINKEVRNELAN